MADTANEKIVLFPFGAKMETHYYEREGNVYFAFDGNAIKIGFSFRDARTRIRDLQQSSSRHIKLLWTMRGNLLKEQELHRHFSHLRIQGEWFRDDGEIRQFIRDLKRGRARAVSQREFIELLKRRPKIALRHVSKPDARLSIESYMLFGFPHTSPIG